MYESALLKIHENMYAIGIQKDFIKKTSGSIQLISSSFFQSLTNELGRAAAFQRAKKLDC